MQTSTSAIYVTYGSLLVSALAHFGWVLNANDAVAIIAGVVAIISTVYNHTQVVKANKVASKGI